MGYADEDVDQIMKSFMYTGEYSHKEYHPVLNFVSGVLDVTIIKPLIESIVGQDLITGEKLTDFERGMQFVDAFLGIITLGQGAYAVQAANLLGREALGTLVKTWAVDALADAAAYTVGYAFIQEGDVWHAIRCN